MIKNALCLFLLLVCMSTALANALQLTTEKKNTVDKNHYFTISLEYPKLSGPNAELNKNFNKTVTDLLTSIVNDFKKDIQSPDELRKLAKSVQIPLKADSNTLSVGYSVYEVNQQHMSVLFVPDIFYYGAAHPNSYFKSLNYDNKTNKILALSDVFKDKSDYLNVISKICYQQLKAEFLKGDPEYNNFEVLEAGMKPIADNFNHWNFTEAGILFSFSAYQVASRAEGPQQCLVRNEQIEKLKKTSV